MHTDESISKMFFYKTSSWICKLVLSCIPFYGAQSFAGEWSITPRLQLQEIYSDNIRLLSKNKKSAFVTSVSPGISIIGQTARNRLNLNYTMQNLYNANGDSGINIFNQLQFNSQHTLATNRLFLEAGGSVGQQNISNTQIASDNISGSGSRSNISTVSLSPYWTPHFGNFADGILRLNFNTVTSDNNSATFIGGNGQPQVNAFSDTLTLGEDVQLNSGNYFKRVTWNAAFNNTKNFRSGGQDVKFQNYYGTLRTHINKHFNVFATAGQSDNSFQTNNGSIKNGFYYTIGGQWSPSEHYSIEAGGGNNSYVTVYISPMQRLNWTTTYRHNTVGLNTGSTWNTNLRYQTRNSTWYLTHTNDTTTTQAIFLSQQNPTANITQQNAIIFLPNLIDDVYVRKIWNFGVNFNTGKSTVRGNFFDEKRTSQNTGTTENVRGVSASWYWQFTPKTSVYIQPMWQQIDRDGSLVSTLSTKTATKDNRYDVTIGVSRAITNRLNGSLEFRHLDQSSDLDTNNYQENRATASLFMRF